MTPRRKSSELDGVMQKCGEYTSASNGHHKHSRHHFYSASNRAAHAFVAMDIATYSINIFKTVGRMASSMKVTAKA